jgi:hypothetical protein
MIDRPAQHAMYQHAREVEHLSATPQSIRAGDYLDKVRRVSDVVARVAAMPGMDETVQQSLRKKQDEISRLRETVAHLVDGANTASFAMTPSRREMGQGGK